MQDFISKPPLRSPVDVDERVSTAWAAWFEQAFSILFAQAQSGATAQRPTVGLYTGRRFWDETLSMPIYWSGTAWLKSDGTAA